MDHPRFENQQLVDAEILECEKLVLDKAGIESAGNSKLKVLVISSSLNPESNSRVLAKAGVDVLREAGAEPDFVDLRDLDLPICDGDEAYHAESVRALYKRIDDAQAVLFAVPIYNFDVSAAAKNVIEVTGNAWKEKVVGFVCAAGGKASYMSIMGLANSLMLDFRCIIIPRFVYATKDDFGGEAITNEAIRERIVDVCERIVTITGALETHGAKSAR